MVLAQILRDSHEEHIPPTSRITGIWQNQQKVSLLALQFFLPLLQDASYMLLFLILNILLPSQLAQIHLFAWLIVALLGDFLRILQRIRRHCRSTLTEFSLLSHPLIYSHNRILLCETQQTHGILIMLLQYSTEEPNSTISEMYTAICMLENDAVELTGSYCLSDVSTRIFAIQCSSLNLATTRVRQIDPYLSAYLQNTV